MNHLILPGLDGSGPGHWQSWWLGAVPGSRFIEQDEWSKPTPLQWETRAEAEIAESPGAILIAHSLGCALVANLVRRCPDLPIQGALLVAPADVDDRSWTPPGVAAFGPMPTTKLPFPSIVVASRNDPYVAFERARHFAQSWGADFIDHGFAGHINTASGHGPWPDGVRLVERLSAGPSRRRFSRDRNLPRDRGGNAAGLPPFSG